MVDAHPDDGQLPGALRFRRSHALADMDGAVARFIEDGDPQERCRSLAAALTQRLKEASNSHQALEWILADLRELGHEVAQWDEIISDAWSSPQNDRCARAARRAAGPGVRRGPMRSSRLHA